MVYRQGDVFLARLHPSKGKEPGKDRPVIVVQGDALNEANFPTCIVVPLSSLPMPETQIRPLIEEPFLKKKSYVLLDQVQAIDVKKRFLKKMGTVSPSNLNKIISSLKDIF